MIDSPTLRRIHARHLDTKERESSSCKIQSTPRHPFLALIQREFRSNVWYTV